MARWEIVMVVIVLVISATATAVGRDNRFYVVEVTGKFKEGNVPITDIKIASRENVDFTHPKFLFMGESVERVDSETFKIQLKVDPTNCIK